MNRYVALLRGINVGGNAKVPMADLRVCFEGLGYGNVSTYINSGNVLFSSQDDTIAIKKQIEACLEEAFGFLISVVVIEATRYEKILSKAPLWWGKDPEWKHNLIFMLEPYDMNEVVSAIGALKPDIEAIQSGEGYIFQSLSFKKFGQTTTGKIASNPIYKQMTIRNFNTAQKLRTLLKNGII